MDWIESKYAHSLTLLHSTVYHTACPPENYQGPTGFKDQDLTNTHDLIFTQGATFSQSERAHNHSGPIKRQVPPAQQIVVYFPDRLANHRSFPEPFWPMRECSAGVHFLEEFRGGQRVPVWGVTLAVGSVWGPGLRDGLGVLDYAAGWGGSGRKWWVWDSGSVCRSALFVALWVFFWRSLHSALS